MALRLHYRIFRVFALAIISTLTTPVVFAQNSSLTEIQKEFDSGKLNANQTVAAQLAALNNAGNHKCATPVTIMAHKYWNQLSGSTQSAYLDSFSEQTIAATEFYVSPMSKFRIRYETDGNDAVPPEDLNSNSVPDYVEWVAEAADSSYRHEIIHLGFTDPIPDGEQYLIILADLPVYGLTRFSSGSPGGTVIEVENDFIGFPANTDPEGDQKGAVKVTVAHEFKHAIQYAQNGWSGDADRWAEMDATLMEEVVYDPVNDYYNYLDGFANNLFGAPSSTLIPGSYEDMTWALYFHERFGEFFWTGVWDRIEASPSIAFFQAIEEELIGYDVSFEEAATENFLWHYASGFENFSTVFGFDESGLYPGPDIEDYFTEIQLELTLPLNMSRFSGRYFEFELLEENNNLVKIDYLPSSSEVQVGLIAYYSDLTVETRLLTNPTAEELNSSETRLSWAEIDRLGLVFFNTSSTQTQSFQFRVYDYVPTNIESPQLSQNHPNPFNPNTVITVSLPFSQRVKLTVYDYLGREVRILADEVLSAGENPIPFSALSLSSGIYFYRLETQDKVITKRMTFIK